jgi:hypothetical protein
MNTIPSKAKLSLRNKGETKILQDKQKWREFIITRTALQMMVKGVLSPEATKKATIIKTHESIKPTRKVDPKNK